ncbi:MAG TPA: enoyl-CoA hydratase/isomerase family protein [Acidimicrobiales bacterium]
MAYSTIRFSVAEGIARLQLDRPGAANAINGALASELFDAATRLRWDNSVRVVLLTAAGKVFCGGGDIGEFGAWGEDLPEQVARVTHDLHGALTAFAAMDAPLVAAVGGSAGGAGLSLVAAADLVVASTRAKFTMAYTGVGLTPDAGSSFYLARAVGLRRATELVLTNRVLSASEAEAWGLVNRVVDEDALESTCEELVASLASGPTRAYGAARRVLARGASSDLAAALALESETIAATASTTDAREGVSAFVQRRPPRFEGR